MKVNIMSTEEAINVLSAAMKSDPELALGWHCNLAMMALDAGAPHKESNTRAGELMHRIFGVRTDEDHRIVSDLA